MNNDSIAEAKMPHSTSSRSSAPLSPVSRAVSTELTSLSAAVLAWDDDWKKSHRDGRIRKTATPSSFGDAIQTIDSLSGTDLPAVVGASEFMPCVTLPGVPVDKYPEYLDFLYRATMAAMRVERPGLYNSIETSMAYYLTAVIVAVRVGVWSSTKKLPLERHAPSYESLYYDEKRDRLWVRAVPSASAAAAWRCALDTAPLVRPGTLEVMLMWCKVSPLVLCTACTGLYALSNTYSTPFVDEAVARYMRSTASPEAKQILRLDRSVVWDAARAAAVEGLSEVMVRTWTNDPLLAVTAERRIMTNEASLRASRLRGERVLAKLDLGETMLNLVSSDPGSVEHQRALWEAVARAKAGVQDTDDDNESVATALLDRVKGTGLDTLPEIPEENLSGSLTPLVPEMPPEVSLADRTAVANIIRNAHSTGEQAASVLGNMDADMPAEW